MKPLASPIEKVERIRSPKSFEYLDKSKITRFLNANTDDNNKIYDLVFDHIIEYVVQYLDNKSSNT